MIFTVLFLSDKGVWLESKTEDPAFQQALRGKQIFYIVSSTVDGPKVVKFGIAQDAARRGWNVQRLRQYLKAYGAHEPAGARQGCRGVKLHFLAVTSYEAHSLQMVADRYKHSTLVRLEAFLKRHYARRPESLKSQFRGDERVAVRPAVLIKQVLDLKTRLRNQVDAATNRRRYLPRRAKQRSLNNISRAPPKTYEIARFVGDKPWRYQIKWKGYRKPTWEPKATLRRDLGARSYEALVRDFEVERARTRATSGRRRSSARKHGPARRGR